MEILRSSFLRPERSLFAFEVFNFLNCCAIIIKIRDG